MDLLECESKQTPLRVLYAFFNYVSLGQWQLARVCIRRLDEELAGGALILDQSDPVEVRSLLRTIVLYPNTIWRYSPSIPSPYHLSWLCFNEYKQIVEDVTESLPAELDDLIQFHLLLYTVEYELKIDSGCKERVIAYYYNRVHNSNITPTQQTRVESIDQDILSFLSTILKSNRIIGDCIIQQLILSDNNVYAENNIKLFRIYVSCIEESLQCLKETALEERNAVFDTIYGILGIFDPPRVYHSKLKIGDLFCKLLQTEEFGLKRELIYNSIIGRETPNLVHVLSEVEALRFVDHYKVDFISKNSQLFDQRDLKWNNIFLQAFYQKTHVLEDILDRGLQLVRENDFDSLADLMKDSEWKPLGSLLLLLAWDHCRSMQSAKKLLDTLYHPQDQMVQPALFSAIQKLYYQVNLADWCIEKVRPILSSSSSSSISSGSFQQEGELFSRLESQSILYMLHQSNSLSTSDPKEIMELLKMSPSIDDIPGTPTVTKSSSQSRDIAVYRAFCALRLTMDAILCSAQLGNLTKDERGKCQILEILSFSKMCRSVSGDVFSTPQTTTTTTTDSLASTHTTTPYESDNKISTDLSSLIIAVDGYLNRILEEVKGYLQAIYPLYYRLEIIENIYSLLFLKYEDLVTETLDSDDSRSQHFYTRSDVKEYLTLSISRNVGYKHSISMVSNGDTDSERSSSLTASTNSLVKEKRVEPLSTGFLLSRPMIEKMLQLLRDSIYDIQTSKYAFRRESIPGEVRAPSTEQSIYSSINHETLHSRLSQLEKCISEATWRYKLVITTETPAYTLEDSSVSYSEDTVCSKWEAELNIGAESQSSSDLDLSNDEDDSEMVDRRHSSISLGKGQTQEKGLTKSEVVYLSDREQMAKTNSLDLKIGDSGDEGDTEDKETILKPKLKSVIPSRKPKRKFEKISRDNSSRQNIIRKMLSSPVNLLNMCLKLGNFVSAYEVIKMFKLEGHIGAQMVHFAEKMESIGTEMSAVTKQDEETSFDMLEIMSRDNVSGEDYDRLTMSLSTNSVAMDELVNILVSTNLSRIMLSGQESMLVRAGESVVLRQLDHFVPSLIILDLLCAYDISYETSRELLKSATQKLSLQHSTGPVPPKLSRTSSAGSVRPLATKAFDKHFFFDNYSLSRPLVFLQTINEIIKTAGDLVLPLQLVRNGHMLKNLTPNLLLTKFTDPLHSSQFVSRKKLREFQYRAVERVFRAVKSTLVGEELGVVNEMMLANITSSLNDLFKAFSTNREGTLLPSNATMPLPDNPTQSLDLGTLEAVDSFGEELDTLSVEFPQMNSMKYTYSYFDWFFQHLETIRSFLIKHNLQENVTSLSSMVLLKESPSKIVARLIFEKGLKPEMLEELVRTIRLDVVLIMIRFTCPALNSCSTRFSAYPFLARETPILNPATSPTGGSCDTLQSLLKLSEDILTQALDIINDNLSEDEEFLGIEYLSECASHPDFVKFEECLECLQNVDLLLLTTDEDKIVFYTNIVNSLNTHACITQSVLMKRRGEGLSIFGVTTMFCFFIQSCYSLGQLGIVNLLDLQFKILRLHSLDESFIASKGLRTLTYSSNKRDRFRDFAVRQSDSRLVFVVANCVLGNIKPQVLTKENFQEILTAAAVVFCSLNVELRPQTSKDVRIVRVAEFLTWYTSHFNTKRELSYEHKKDLIILNLQPFLSKPLQAITRNSIEVIPHIWKFGFYAQSEGINLLEVSTTFHVSPFIAPDPSSSSLLPPEYSLNESTLHYISTHNRVLSKLATFVCLPTQPIGFSKRVSVSEDEKLQSIKSVSSIASNDKSAIATFKLFGRNLHSQNSEADDSNFDRNVERILNIFSDTPVLKSYFEDSFSTLSFARRIITFIRSDLSESTPHLQQIEINPPISFEQSPDGSSKPLFFFIHELFLGYKSNSSCIRTCILSLDHLIAKRRWINSFDIINSETFLPYRDCLWYRQIKDLILIGCVNYIRRQREKTEEFEQSKVPASSEESFKFLMQLSNFELLGEIVLDIIYEWNDTQLCLNILQHAYSNLTGESNLKRRLYNQLEKIKVYSEIMNTLSRPDVNQLSNEESIKVGGYPEWKHWRNIKRQTKAMPQVIVRHLSRKGEFKLARRWAKIHEVPDPIYLHIERDHALFLFTLQDTDFSNMYLILEEFNPRDLCSKLCLSILESLTYPKQILFVVQFALDQLTSYLSGEEIELLRKLQIGSQALLCIDSHSVLQYTRLADDVVLLVEQLIMNLKIQWAAEVVKRVSRDLTVRASGTTLGIYTSLIATIDEMAFRYAELAIDLRSSNDESLSDVSSPPITSPNANIFQFETIPESAVDNESGSGDSSHAQTKPIPVSRGSVLPKTPMHTGNFSAPAPVSYMTGGRRGSSQFMETMQESILEVGQVMVRPEAVSGIKISKRTEWTPDTDVERCQVCRNICFGIINRKHHCRRCGKVVCRDCSPNKYHVDGYQGLVRVCNYCHKNYYSKSPIETQESGLKMKGHKKSNSLSSSFLDKETSDSLFKPRHSYFWELNKNNRDKNNKLRTDFYFEQAPNPDLCINIAMLHSDSDKTAKFLLELAVKLSEKLKDVFDSTDVDCIYVVDMIKKLLNKSKLLFSVTEYAEGVNTCDLYLDRIGVIQSIISIQDSEIVIPSLPQLSGAEETRYLRDTLIRYSYWSLALDISTKCLLDTHSVWISWGLSCLKDGRYDVAREKFKHCLQPVGTIPQQQTPSQSNQSLVSQIVEQIENSILPSWNADEILLSLRKDNLLSLNSIIDVDNRSSSCVHMNQLQFEEVQYYLRSYGSHRQMLEFFVKYKMVKKACLYLQAQNSTSETFRDGLLVPCLKQGLWEELKKEITTNDPTLRNWSFFFKENCDYFIKRSMYNIAYELQNFIKDHVDAAKTCILFYQSQKPNEPIVSYKILHSRLHHLEEAKKHLTQAMDSKTSKVRQESKPIADLNSYFENIKLQIDVTQFFHLCQSKSLFASNSKLGRPPFTQTPTLFGSPALKTKLSAEIIVAGNKAVNGIELVLQIIKTFRLVPCDVFSEAVAGLLLAKRSEELKETIQCYARCYKVTDMERDLVVIQAVKEIPLGSLDPELVVSLLVCDKSKVEVNIQFGRLRNAYLAAVKTNMIEEVKRIRELAVDKGDNAIKEICERYLLQHAAKK